jgi:hypothetical protein
MNIKNNIFQCLYNLNLYERKLKEEIKQEKGGSPGDSFSDERHLRETLHWILRAQDAGGDGGVSRAYSASTLSEVRYKGWEPSYPETSGYIIPTLIAASRHLDDPICLQRAGIIADWEIKIQLHSGAVMGSVVTAPPSPAVFNTGQVIFGWLAWFRESRQEKYLHAALKGGDYLLSVQDADGAFNRGDSNFALKGATTYNTRTAWALIELGIVADSQEYIDSGRKNIEYALSKQNRNGWFRDNCLNDPEKPLLHTIIYTTRGILESGIALNEKSYIEAALKALDALMRCQRNDGGIAGRLDSDWTPTADWDCLTGDAQAAIAWIRAHTITGDTRYRETARKAIDFVKRTQKIDHTNPCIRGGVKGSFPFDGPYGRFEMLNWAAKFFCDALMMVNDDRLAAKGIKG